MTTLRLLVLLALPILAAAADPWLPAPGLVVQPDGRILAGGLAVELRHFDAAWRQSSPRQAMGGTGLGSGDTWHLEADWITAGGPARLVQTLRRVDGDGLVCEARLAGTEEAGTWALSVALDGSRYRGGEVRIDGAPCLLPVESSRPTLRAAAPARRVSIPLPAGGWLELTGDLLVMLQDDQSWGVNTYSLRLLGDGNRAISVHLRLRPLAVRPIDLPTDDCRPRRDEIAGDRIGGWTDQGDNDLRACPSGPLTAAGFPFRIADGAAVLGGDRFAWLKRSTRIEAGDRTAACLYLLHATAWSRQGGSAIGTITARYRDGNQETQEVRLNRDVADWWEPRDRLPNAALGWTGSNPHARIGLFVSRFPLANRALERIELAATGESVWLVVGAALGEDAPLPAQAPDILAAGPRWQPIDVPWEVEPGSALDLSFLSPGPVDGRLVAQGGDLVRESDRATTRLLGANLCFSANFPDRPLAARMAKALRAMGHNAVRFHHMDDGLVDQRGDGLGLDAERLDRLDYLFACCKKEGLWVTTDLYISRTVPMGAIPELPRKRIQQEFKALIPLLPSALENWKRFATAFLTHRNPYTGMTWGEDPALATLSLVNEDNFPSAARLDAEVQALVESHFSAWLATQTASAGTGPERERMQGRWMRERQAAACDAMREHVRSLGVRALTTSANMRADWWSLAVRDRFDFVDNHSYHDHPRFPVADWKLPFAFNQQSAVEQMLAVPARIAHTRRLDRPFTVSELNYCLPNHRRAEYAAGAAAVAGLQGWSGIWRFAFSHDLKLLTGEGRASGFDLCRDPIALLGERALALLYRRGDVAPAPWSAALVYDPAVAERHPDQEPDTAVAGLALHVRTGCLPAAAAQQVAIGDLRCLLQDPLGGAVQPGRLPVFAADARLPGALVAAGLVPAGALDPAGGRMRSADGQLDLDAGAGRLLVSTRRSVAAVLPAGATVQAGGVRITNSDEDPATVVAAALDAAPLASSARILVLHLTDAQNLGIRFGDRRHTLVEDWGRTPMLARAGLVRVHLPGSAAATAFALDLHGRRREQVALAADGDGWRLDAAVIRPWGASLAWEIVR